jgi:hypothetical protein
MASPITLGTTLLLEWQVQDAGLTIDLIAGIVSAIDQDHLRSFLSITVPTMDR